MIAYRLASAALDDATEAAAYYERAVTGLGQDFFDELDTAINRIRTFPNLGRPRGDRLRSLFLNKFPIDVIYYVDNQTVVVIAISHQSRLPGFWKDRIS